MWEQILARLSQNLVRGSRFHGFGFSSVWWRSSTTTLILGGILTYYAELLAASANTLRPQPEPLPHLAEHPGGIVRPL
jgi:hypothetical protein